MGAPSLKARPTATGIKLTDLSLGLKGMLLQGDASWDGAPGSTISWYKGKVAGKNLADVLKAWGYAPNVTSDSFELNADGRWPGSPAWVATKRYSGSLDATLRRGQFVEVEGGAQALGFLHRGGARALAGEQHALPCDGGLVGERAQGLQRGFV